MLDGHITVDTMICPHCGWMLLNKGRREVNYRGEDFIMVDCTNCTYAFYIILAGDIILGYDEWMDDPETGGSFLG